MDQDILQLAERLGKAIADSPQSQKLQAAHAALNAKPDLAQLLKDYQQQADRLARLEAEGKTIEVDDKHRLRDLRAKLLADDDFKRLTGAQVDFVDLMRKVNQKIQSQIGPTSAGATPA